VPCLRPSSRVVRVEARPHGPSTGSSRDRLSGVRFLKCITQLLGPFRWYAHRHTNIHSHTHTYTHSHMQTLSVTLTHRGRVADCTGVSGQPCLGKVELNKMEWSKSMPSLNPGHAQHWRSGSKDIEDIPASWPPFQPTGEGHQIQ
jgi:hypothetical protein